MNFRKECISGDSLNKTTWTFQLFSDRDELAFVLNSYYKMDRLTKRHSKWDIKTRYERISGRDNNIEEKDVPMPEFLFSEIREFVNDKLKVKKWSEYKNG